MPRQARRLRPSSVRRCAGTLRHSSLKLYCSWDRRCANRANWPWLVVTWSVRSRCAKHLMTRVARGRHRRKSSLPIALPRSASTRARAAFAGASPCHQRRVQGSRPALHGTGASLANAPGARSRLIRGARARGDRQRLYRVLMLIVDCVAGLAMISRLSLCSG
jgi:hypothetical protein